MLGFGGHFLTKARHYSLRFRDLRDARITYRRRQDPGPEHGPIRTTDHTDDETTLIIGTFTYAGTGWRTTGDALLANTAADQARKRRQAGHDELADEYVSHATVAPHNLSAVHWRLSVKTCAVISLEGTTMAIVSASGSIELDDLQLYRVKDAMRLLKLSRTVIYEQLRTGRLGSVKQGRARLIPSGGHTRLHRLLENEAKRNDDSHDSTQGTRRREPVLG